MMEWGTGTCQATNKVHDKIETPHVSSKVEIKFTSGRKYPQKPLKRVHWRHKLSIIDVLI